MTLCAYDITFDLDIIESVLIYKNITTVYYKAEDCSHDITSLVLNEITGSHDADVPKGIPCSEKMSNIYRVVLVVGGNFFLFFFFGFTRLLLTQ